MRWQKSRGSKAFRQPGSQAARGQGVQAAREICSQPGSQAAGRPGSQVIGQSGGQAVERAAKKAWRGIQPAYSLSGAAVAWAAAALQAAQAKAQARLPCSESVGACAIC